MLFEPHIFYHHVFLITLYTCILGGMGYVQYQRHPHNPIWLCTFLLFLGYIGLVVLDSVHPPKGVVHDYTGSVDVRYVIPAWTKYYNNITMFT